MADTRYVAVLEQAEDGGFGVWFPDFPGCVSAGDTMEAACVNAQEALELHVQGMLEDGDCPPSPQPYAAVGDVLFTVEIDVPATADVVYTRLNITLPNTLVKAIDQVASGNRSAYLAQAASEKLTRDPLIRRLAETGYRR